MRLWVITSEKGREKDEGEWERMETYPWALMLKLKQPSLSQPRESAPHYSGSDRQTD